MSTTTPGSSTASPTRRVHPFNTVFGLLFLAVAGAWLAHEQGSLDGEQLGRAVAVGLIVLGLLGLVATVVISRRGRRSTTVLQETTTEATAEDPDA